MKAQGFTEGRLQLLSDISGAFRPDVLTALVGVSGAGKTTLMDVLAGRKTSGTIEGDIKLSGYPKIQETFARISGYCEQTDIHSPNVTVYESLVYSAWLRLSSEVDENTRKVRVLLFGFVDSMCTKENNHVVVLCVRARRAGLGVCVRVSLSLCSGTVVH